MEDGLGRPSHYWDGNERSSLNPCFNGRWSRTINWKYDIQARLCLNPCFNGRWSRTSVYCTIFGGAVVLILVLMEDGLGRPSHYWDGNERSSLNPCFNGRWSRTINWKYDIQARLCLNPCFNGRWSRTSVYCTIFGGAVVLILVLMEDGLGPQGFDPVD